MTWLNRKPLYWILIGTILLHFWLAVSSLVDDSPTMDEQNHIARGLTFLRTGDARLSLEHPPLTNSLSALPVLLLPDVTLPTDHESFAFPDPNWYEYARQLLWEVNDDVTRIVFLARIPIVFLTLALALTGFHFAKAYWGKTAAYFTPLFLLLDPNIIAHGRYSTTDLGGMLFIFLGTFLLWQFWQRTDWSLRHLPLATLGLGAAFGSKLSTLTFLPILVLFALIDGKTNAKRWQNILKLIATSALSLIVIWVIFGFQWQHFYFKSPFLLFLNAYRGPLPTFFAGIEQILFLSGGGRLSFLNGHTSAEGFPLYFPIAFAVKTPTVTLIALVVSLISLLSKQAKRRKALGLLVIACAYFFIASRSSLNIGYRHLFPMLPFLYLLIGGLAEKGKVLVPSLVAASLLVSSLLIYPHFVSYFNLPSGGPDNGGNILIDSNVDWGQDLLRLKGWMDKNGVEKIYLGWFGTAVPEHYNIHYKPLPGLPYNFDLWWDVPFDTNNPQSGIYAISASALWEPPLSDEEKTVYQYFREIEPSHKIGHSIFIYEVP